MKCALQRIIANGELDKNCQETCFPLQLAGNAVNLRAGDYEHHFVRVILKSRSAKLLSRIKLVNNPAPHNLWRTNRRRRVAASANKPRSAFGEYRY